jgi:hypothetical protein
MANIAVAVMNASTVLTDNAVNAVVPALQTQVRDHFAPAWGIDADLTFVPTGSQPMAGAWWLVILDNSDQAGALGYHDVTNEGLPLGKVFAATSLLHGLQWTVTASHELLEMLADPEINLTVFVQSSARRGILYAYEVCDACEADEFGYQINNIQVSDFVYPAWFESFRQRGSTQFDHRQHLRRPFELLSGGYIGAFNVTAGSGWTQLVAREAPHSALAEPDQLEEGPYDYRIRPHVGSRRERRRTTRDRWLKSLEPRAIAARMEQHQVVQQRTNRVSRP